MSREQPLVADAREPAGALGAPERLRQALANLERVERGSGGEVVDDEARVERGDRRRRGARPDDGGALGCRDDEDERDRTAVEALPKAVRAWASLGGRSAAARTTSRLGGKDQ